MLQAPPRRHDLDISACEQIIEAGSRFGPARREQDRGRIRRVSSRVARDGLYKFFSPGPPGASTRKNFDAAKKP